MSRLGCREICFTRRGTDGAERPVLNGITADFGAGETALILGPTGAGKTTLLSVIALLQRPTAGEIHWEGRAVSRWLGPHRDRWRRRVGIIFQGARLLGDLTALENVLLPLIARHPDLAEIRQRGWDALTRMGADHLAAEPARRLSGGERQRVAAARALAGHPSIILADEPTAHQDNGGARIILTALADAARTGAAVIIAGHDPRLLKPPMGDGPRYRMTGGRLDREA